MMALTLDIRSRVINDLEDVLRVFDAALELAEAYELVDHDLEALGSQMRRLRRSLNFTMGEGAL